MSDQQEESRAIQLKDELLARLSHDLRTPLSAILGWAKALQVKRGDPAALERGLDAISRNAATQARLLDELLAMNQILSGTLVLEPRPVAFAAVVAAAIDTIRAAAEARELRLETPFDPPALTVSGDPDRLQQVVVNLLTHAVASSPPGGRIEVLLRRDERQLELTVRDEGSGGAALPGGLELDLAIAGKLVELHGGSIEAASPGPGAGMSHMVRLPLSG
ncbi:MAG: HAMP domain-containing histidine kinase [Burkholderiales bacterium]|nr:HAMP domain-containing histidine kinase [Burkholderiales bacterium]